MTAIATTPAAVFFPWRTASSSPDSRELDKHLMEIVEAALTTASTNGLRETLNELQWLYRESTKAGWDGYNASPVSPLSFLYALQFIFAMPRSMPAPEVAIEPDGSVGFQWLFDKDSSFVISLSDRGILSYAGIFDGEARTHGTERLDDEIPIEVLAHIARVCSTHRRRSAASSA